MHLAVLFPSRNLTLKERPCPGGQKDATVTRGQDRALKYPTLPVGLPVGRPVPILVWRGLKIRSVKFLSGHFCLENHSTVFDAVTWNDFQINWQGRTVRSCGKTPEVQEIS